MSAWSRWGIGSQVRSGAQGTARIVLADCQADPEHLIRDLSPPDHTEWIYLGSDAKRNSTWERALGLSHPKIELNPGLDQAADDLRPHFQAWLTELGERNADNPEFWVSELAEANPQLSSLFVNCAYVWMIRKLLGVPRQILVVGESTAVLRVIRQLPEVADAGGSILVHGRRLHPRIPTAIRVAALASYFVWRSAAQMVAARQTRRGRPSIPPERVRILGTYFHDRQRSPDGVFRDQYLPGLEEHLIRGGRPVLILPTLADPASNPARQYKWLRAASSCFLIAEDWLRLSDYLGALRLTISVAGPVRPIPPLADLAIDDLVIEDRRHRSLSLRPAAAWLAYRLPSRLARAGLETDGLLTWSENQIHDRGLALGWRAAFPESPRVWIQNTPLFPNLISLLPTSSQCKAGASGDRVICSGPRPAAILSTHSSRELEATVGAGLRYQYLHDHQIGGEASSWDIQRALVALPASPLEARSILEMVASVRNEGLDRIQWSFKLHPDPVEIPARLLPRPDETIQGHLADLAGSIDTVVTTGSGIALEAVALGLDVVLIGSRHGLTYNPLAWFPELGIQPCYTVESVKAALADCGRHSAADRQDRRRLVLDAWFHPVSDLTMAVFVD